MTISRPAGPLRTHTEEPSQEIVVLGLEGEIDAFTEPDFRDALHNVLRKGRHTVVSFERVTYMDASAARVVDAALATLRGTPQQLAIVGSLPIIHKVLELCLGDTVQIFHSVAEAIAGVHGTRP